jgi:hypothetical protein
MTLHAAPEILSASQVRAAATCLETLVLPQTAKQLCEANAEKVALSLLGAAHATCDHTAATQCLKIINTLAWACDSALIFFAVPSSLSVIVAVALEPSSKPESALQYAAVKASAAVVRARRDYPASVGTGAARQFAQRLSDAGIRNSQKSVS